MKKPYKSIILLPTIAMSTALLSSCGGYQKNNFAYDLDFSVDVSGQKIKMWLVSVAVLTLF